MHELIIIIAVVAWIIRSIATAVGKASKPTYPPGTPLSTRPATFGVPPAGAPYSAQAGGEPWPPQAGQWQQPGGALPPQYQPPQQAGSAAPWAQQTAPGTPWAQQQPQVAAEAPWQQGARTGAEAPWQQQAQVGAEAPWQQRPGAQVGAYTAAGSQPAIAPAPPSWAPAPSAPQQPPGAYSAGPWNAGTAPIAGTPAQQPAWPPQGPSAPRLAGSERKRSAGPANRGVEVLPQTPPSGNANNSIFDEKEQALFEAEPNQPIEATPAGAKAAEPPLAAMFRQPNSLLSAVILHEVLGPPRCRSRRETRDLQPQ